jgi:hypothetical protein
MCRVWRGYDVTGVGGGEFTLQLIPRQKVAPLYWRSDTHTHTHTRAAEQEKYYITNVLKKPQRINVRQFVCQVEQLNACIAQIPCFYYSPNVNASTKPENVLFTEAELGSHVLRMCLIQWQDQYNMNKKGMTLMDMLLLLTSLEGIECVCTHKKAK